VLFGAEIWDLTPTERLRGHRDVMGFAYLTLGAPLR